MYLELLQACQSAQTILITGPQSPDGDSIGACVALAEMIHQKHRCHIDISGVPTHQYLHLHKIDTWKPDQNLLTQYDIAIVVDGNRNRLIQTVETSYDASSLAVLIDHHKSTNASEYDIAILDPFATSTCSMIYEILQSWECTLTIGIAEALYVGILFDTGGFQHSNTDAKTLRIAANLMETGFDANKTYLKVIKEKRPQGWQLQSAMFQNSEIFVDGLLHIAWITQKTMSDLGCDNGDLEGLVNDLRCTKGIHMAVLIIEKSHNLTKVSLRSNPNLFDKEGVDCAAMAQQLSTKGGGHTRAAGASVDLGLRDTIELVTASCGVAIQEQLK